MSFNGPSRKMSIEHCFSIWPYTLVFRKCSSNEYSHHSKFENTININSISLKGSTGQWIFENCASHLSVGNCILHDTIIIAHCTSSTQMVSFHQISIHCFLSIFPFSVFLDFFPNTNGNNWKCFGSKAPFDANRLTSFNQGPAAFHPTTITKTIEIHSVD